MSRGIRLHKTLGLNPRLTVCYVCGKELADIALLGDQNFLWHCNDCDINFIGKEKTRKCVQCKRTHIERVRELDKFEKIPLGLCEQCQKLKDEAAKAVAEGGVYWHCKTCGSSGALTRDNPIAPLVRESLQVRPPEPCGVEVSNCPACAQKK